MFGNDKELTNEMIAAINNTAGEVAKASSNMVNMANAINTMSRNINRLTAEIKRKNEIEDAKGHLVERP